MPISASDFSFVYSGGPSNGDPAASLGGSPSGIPVAGTINNLFDDVDPERAASGSVDYRCFYVFNDSPDAALYDAKVFIAAQVPEGATADIGFLLQNDRQAVTVQGKPTRGSMTLAYDGFPFTVEFSANRDQFADGFKSALKQATQLTGLVVDCIDDNGAITLTVEFTGADGNKYHPTLTVGSNDVAGADDIKVSKLTNGSPINAIASTILDQTAAPPGVGFSNPDADNPVRLGTVMPGDGFPVWVRRSTPEEAAGVKGDGFQFRMLGEPTQVVVIDPPATFSFASNGEVDVTGQGSFTLRGPGEIITGMEGGLTFRGDASYTLTLASDGKPHIFYTMSGGVTMSSPAVGVVYTKRIRAQMRGGIVEGGTSVVKSTGVTAVTTCQIFPCDEFPQAWMLSIGGIPDTSYCACKYVPRQQLLQFMFQRRCSWGGIIINGDPLNQGQTFYYELRYDVVGQYWELKTHAPYNPPYNTTDCSIVVVRWHRTDWNCCGVNTLDNASFVGGDGLLCIIRGLTVTLTPVKYCTPKPCQYRCGKCCREFKMPDQIVLSVGFDEDCPCRNSPLQGQFTMSRLPQLDSGICTYGADMVVPPSEGGGATWLMEYDDNADSWILFTSDPEHRYFASFTVTDRNFMCCDLCADWQFVQGSVRGVSCNACLLAFAATNPLDKSTCQ